MAGGDGGGEGGVGGEGGAGDDGGSMGGIGGSGGYMAAMIWYTSQPPGLQLLRLSVPHSESASQ